MKMLLWSPSSSYLGGKKRWFLGSSCKFFFVLMVIYVGGERLVLLICLSIAKWMRNCLLSKLEKQKKKLRKKTKKE